MATEIVIPMLGITVEKGKIIEWLKNEGDPVEKGESIFVVEADKVTTEVESPASGILAKILLPEGVEVPLLTVVGVITRPGEEVPAQYLKTAAAVAATVPSGPEFAVSRPPPPAPAARTDEDAIRIELLPTFNHEKLSTLNIRCRQQNLQGSICGDSSVRNRSKRRTIVFLTGRCPKHRVKKVKVN